MNPALQQAAAEIMNHAQYGSENGQRVRNTLSPHFERFVLEKIRSLLITETQKAQTLIAEAILECQRQEEAVAKTNHILQNLYK